MSGRFLLQQRDNIPTIIQPGKVGLFGGHLEEGETHLDCVIRELHEEISYFVSAERLEHLVSHKGPDTEVQGGLIDGVFFVARDIPVDQLVITEGSLLIVESNAVGNIESNLAPWARFALRAFMKNE
jgi:8-oxo-dGTP pyrophosphatase MutT (NUDIX family)